jgi:hypothetical protein
MGIPLVPAVNVIKAGARKKEIQPRSPMKPLFWKRIQVEPVKAVSPEPR